MCEIRRLWTPNYRVFTASAFILLLLLAIGAPALAQVSGDSPDTSSTEPGPDVDNNDDEEEDIDEWENDILKITLAPPGEGWIRERLASWSRALAGFFDWTAGGAASSR